MQKLTTDEFIKKAREIHGDKYDYSKVEYTNSATKVCIICSIHGEFWQRPNSHLQGQGCPKCKVDKRKTTLNEFIEKARRIHGDKYDYSKAEYINSYTKVCIICPEHGEFYQIPRSHLSGQGCSKCSGKFMDQEYFIEKSREIHGNKYDYSKVIYKNSDTKVCIICPIHGEFYQNPDNHSSGIGCSKCARNFMDKEYFIEKSKEVHGDKYDYSKVNYVNCETKVCIVCPKHGEFWQRPHTHLSGQGCPKCTKRYMNKEIFVEKALKVHGNKYDYSKVEYINALTKICIICPEHGEFYQNHLKHLSGQGCPKCNMSHLERDVMNFLNRHNIEYEYQKRFKWLGLQSLDFYIPKYKIAIECQGRQHFEPVESFGGENEFKNIQERDKRKKRLCEEHNIKLRYYK